MRSAARLVAALGLFLLGAALAADDSVAVPPLKARVTDLTATLSRGQAASLEADLARFENSRGSQIAILLVPSTKPETIEAYSIRVAEAWKLGRKGIDDGILILVAKNDRKLRIEVGRGLEGAVPDAVARRIVAEIMSPRFKEGDFHGGLQAGAAKLQAVIGGEALAPARSMSSSGLSETVKHAQSLLDASLWVGLLFATILGLKIGRWTGWLIGWVVASALYAVLVWHVSESVALAVVGVFALLICMVVFGSNARGNGWASGGSGSGDGGWSGGGSSDSGFSGGGGDFGGGGASGDW